MKPRAEAAQARQRALLDLLTHLARTGARLPCDDVLGGMIGGIRQSAQHLLRHLLTAGHIRVQRCGMARRVVILADGSTTDWSRTPRKDLPIRDMDPKPVRRRSPASTPPFLDAQRLPPPPPRVIPDWTPRTCQWLDGDARQRQFCGEAVAPRSSYCAAHHVLSRVRGSALRPAPPSTGAP